MKKRILAIFMAATMAVGLLIGCSSSDSPSETSASKEEATDESDAQGISVEWIGKAVSNPWFMKVEAYASREAKTLGVNFNSNFVNEQVDIEQQIAKIESAVANNADAICISVCDSEGAIPALKKAKDAGIKIINFDTRVSDKSVIDAFVGTDDVLGGYMAGEYICKKLNGKGKVAVVNGTFTQSTGVDRYEGFKQACLDYPDIEIVADPEADFDADKAASATSNILAANPDVDAIFATADMMAVSMANVVKSSGINSDDIILVGFDGTQDSCNLLLAGDLDAIVALPEVDEAVMPVRVANILSNNEEFMFDREIIYEPQLVTLGEEEDTDYTVYEFLAERFPLYGVTDTGY